MKDADTSMVDRFVVEADHRAVGVAVRSRGGFRFFSSDPAYAGLEGQLFPHARSMGQAVNELARALTARRPVRPLGRLG